MEPPPPLALKAPPVPFWSIRRSFMTQLRERVFLKVKERVVTEQSEHKLKGPWEKQALRTEAHQRGRAQLQEAGPHVCRCWAALRST